MGVGTSGRLEQLQPFFARAASHHHHPFVKEKEMLYCGCIGHPGYVPARTVLRDGLAEGR